MRTSRASCPALMMANLLTLPQAYIPAGGVNARIGILRDGWQHVEAAERGGAVGKAGGHDRAVEGRELRERRVAGRRLPRAAAAVRRR